MEPENMQLVTHIYVYSNSPKHPYLPIFPVCPPALVILLYDIGAGPEITLSPRGDLCAVTFTPVLDVFCREIIPGGITDDVLPVRTFPEFGCNLHARPLALNVRRKCGLKCDSRQVVSESENLVSLSDTWYVFLLAKILRDPNRSLLTLLLWLVPGERWPLESLRPMVANVRLWSPRARLEFCGKACGYRRPILVDAK
jgi:hypothetical protein